LQRALHPALAKLERHTLHKAGAVVFTAETNRRAYIDERLAPEERTSHIPYFFDAALFATPPPPASLDFQISYLGTFDWSGARSPEIFLRSLARFVTAHPEAREKTRFLFHGNWLPEHNRFITELGLKDIVSIQPAVAYREYIQKLRSSSVLLLVVAEAHNLFMPSKIVDYFGAGRPILAFVPKGSEMAGVLQSAGMGEFASCEFDVEGGAIALEKLWNRHKEGNLQVDSTKTSFWSSETQIPRFIRLVENAS
jgi:hypothetical protein